MLNSRAIKKNQNTITIRGGTAELDTELTNIMKNADAWSMFTCFLYTYPMTEIDEHLPKGTYFLFGFKTTSGDTYDYGAQFLYTTTDSYVYIRRSHGTSVIWKTIPVI